MSWELDIENIAGIRQGSAELAETVNAVRASNWEGKSSFLAAVRTALGCDATLTEGASTGWVELTADGETYHVSLERQNGSVDRSGGPYIDGEYDRTCAALFACLDGQNEVREAVRSDADLEPILTRPLELEEIDREIADHRAERDRIDTELERAREQAERLPSLQRTVVSLEEDLAELREREHELAGDGDDERDEAREELSDLRAERERVRNLIERLENALDRTEKRLEDAYEQLDELEVPDAPDVESEIAEEEAALEEAEKEHELVQSMYSITERIIEENKLDLLGEVEHALGGDSYECWVCGTEVTEEAVQDRRDSIGDQVVELRGDVERRRERIEELQERRDEARKARRRKEDMESEIATLESDMADREESLRGAYERLDTLNEEIEQLETDVEAVDEKLTDVRSEIKYTEAELEDTREEIEQCERAAEKIETLETQRETISEEIADLRDRKERRRAQLREAFDAAIDEVVDLFDTSFETARLGPSFDLIVARNGRDVGLDALSEGERELLGIVTALAGFETYDVDERTPAILLDEVGALADENLSRLVDFLEERTRFLLVTTHPENSDFEDHEISPSNWKVVSPDDPVSTT